MEASAFTLAQYTTFIDKKENFLSMIKSLAPHDVQMEREERVSSLVRPSWLHQNSASGRFPKISFSAEATTISFNFSFSVTLKFTSQFYTLKGSVTQA